MQERSLLLQTTEDLSYPERGKLPTCHLLYQFHQNYSRKWFVAVEKTILMEQDSEDTMYYVCFKISASFTLTCSVQFCIRCLRVSTLIEAYNIILYPCFCNFQLFSLLKVLQKFCSLACNLCKVDIGGITVISTVQYFAIKVWEFLKVGGIYLIVLCSI